MASVRQAASGTPVRVDLLNGFQLTVGGSSASIPTGSRRLVAYLALQERPLERAYVAGTLWSESSPSQSMGCLRSALWRLHEFGRLVVDATGQQLRLDGHVQVDVRLAVETAKLARRGDVPVSAIDAASIDLLIESGDLLPDWYDDWVLFERERLRQLRLHALEAISRRSAAEGRFELAVDAGIAAVHAEPLRESAHIALMRAHLAEGNLSEAIRQHRRYSELILRELQVEPTVSLEELLSWSRP